MASRRRLAALLAAAMALLPAASAGRLAPGPLFEESLSEARMDTLADVFRTLDMNQDGRIDKQELLKAAQFEGDSNLLAVVEKLFAWSDADGDGFLDRAEAERFMTFLDKHVSDLSRTVSTADADSLESLPADLDEHLVSSGENEREEEAADVVDDGLEGEYAEMVAQLFEELDDSGHGEIERQELLEAATYDEDPTFLHLVEKLFAIADANGDGKLDREEAVQLVKLLGEHVSGGGLFFEESGFDDADLSDFSDEEVDEAVFLASAGGEEFDWDQDVLAAKREPGRDGAHFVVESQGAAVAARRGEVLP